jgi:translation initiation factor 2 subunit 1
VGEFFGGNQIAITSADGSTAHFGKQESYADDDVVITMPDDTEFTVTKGTTFSDAICAFQEMLKEVEGVGVSTDPLDCRFYENQYPPVESLVVVTVKQIAEMGAYVQLLEYGNIEGMILLSELSRRRIRSINKLIRVGKNEVVMVLRVDKEKGYIDLSKRRVAQEEAAACEERYNKSKMTHSVLRHVAQGREIPVMKLYETVAWPLYKKFPHVYDAFRLAIVEPDKVFGGLEVDQDDLSALITQIKRKLTPNPIKIRADIEVTCFKYEGIDAVKKALLKGIEKSTPEIPISIKLIAPPLYVMTTQTLEKEEGLAKLSETIKEIEKVLVTLGGTLTVKAEPKVCSTRDDQELENVLKQVEREKQQIDGDAPEDE